MNNGNKGVFINTKWEMVDAILAILISNVIAIEFLVFLGNKPAFRFYVMVVMCLAQLISFYVGKRMNQISSETKPGSILVTCSLLCYLFAVLTLPLSDGIEGTMFMRIGLVASSIFLLGYLIKVIKKNHKAKHETETL